MDHILATIQIEHMNEKGRNILAMHDRRIAYLSEALKETNAQRRSYAKAHQLHNWLMVVRIAMTQRQELRRLRKGRMRYIWNYVPDPD